MKWKLTLCLMLVGGTLVASAQPESDTARIQAEAIYARADAAINRGNFNAFFGMFAPDFHMVDLQGKKSNFGQFKSMLMQQVKSMRDIHVRTRVWNVQLQTQEMSVWVQEELSWRQMSNGRMVPMNYTSRYCDTLRNDGGKWLFTYSQSLPTNEPWTFKTGGK